MTGTRTSSEIKQPGHALFLYFIFTSLLKLCLIISPSAYDLILLLVHRKNIIRPQPW